ncbi:MAG: sigma-54-dependent Fis family transcriptional regulator, partial [Burkholderiales bacterium 28-67-8]
MPSILIVDDEVTFAKNLAKYLTRFGHDVATAATVADGLQLFRSRSPDVLVLDYRLPDGTGMDFIEQVRATDESVHIILITGYGTVELAVDAMKAGANDLLTK